MTTRDPNTDILEQYQNVLHERLVSRRASEDYVYWTRRFLTERDDEGFPNETQGKMFLRNLSKEQLSSSAMRRAEVAIELLITEFKDQNEVA